MKTDSGSRAAVQRLPCPLFASRSSQNDLQTGQQSSHPPGVSGGYSQPGQSSKFSDVHILTASYPGNIGQDATDTQKSYIDYYFNGCVSSASKKTYNASRLPYEGGDDLSRSFDIDFDFGLDNNDEENEENRSNLPSAKKRRVDSSSLRAFAKSHIIPTRNIGDKAVSVALSAAQKQQMNKSSSDKLHSHRTSTVMSTCRASPSCSVMNGDSAPCISAANLAIKKPALAVVSPPKCIQHKLNCLMREVRKESSNKGRMFYACPSKQCNFFKVGKLKVNYQCYGQVSCLG